MNIKRFGVSLDEAILNDLDKMVDASKFPNRSQAIRYLIKHSVVEEKVQDNKIVAGALVIVYDHHKKDISNRLTHLQHDYHHLILSTQHVHLSHEMCLETIALKGKANELRKLSDSIIGMKGIKHGRLVMTDID